MDNQTQQSCEAFEKWQQDYINANGGRMPNNRDTWQAQQATIDALNKRVELLEKTLRSAGSVFNAMQADPALHGWWNAAQAEAHAIRTALLPPVASHE